MSAPKSKAKANKATGARKRAPKQAKPKAWPALLAGAIGATLGYALS